MTKYEELMKKAKRLEKHIDTEWAEKHGAEYDKFTEICENEWNAGNLTDKEFTLLMLTGLYDYDKDLPWMPE